MNDAELDQGPEGVAFLWTRAGPVGRACRGGLLVARLAGATTVIAHSFSAPVQEVEGIAVGTVTAIETEWDAQQGAPFTLVTFSELTVLKGEGG